MPTGPAVYSLWAKLGGDRWTCYYVGQAEYLETRLREHLAGNESNACRRNYNAIHASGYVYAEVVNQSERKGIEKFLYDRLRPECNDVDPGGSPIEVNLPLREESGAEGLGRIRQAA